MLLAIGAIAALLPSGPAAAAKNPSGQAKAGWRALHAGGGFHLRAPKGYRLRLLHGAYVVAGPAGTMTLLSVEAKGSTGEVAAALLGSPLPALHDPDHFGMRLRLKGGVVAEIYFAAAPRGVAVTLLQPRRKRKPKRGAAGAAVAPAQLSNSQRRLFARIAGSARNIQSVPLPVSRTQEQETAIPLKPFTTPDGSAKGMVPDAPGWLATGSKGVLEGANPQQGNFAFGVLATFVQPGSCLPPCGLIEAPYSGVQEALERVWPTWQQKAGLAFSQVHVASQVPGSAGVLGPGEDSGMFHLDYVQDGKPGVGYVIAGTFTFGEGLWYLYYSYIGAFTGVPGAVGDALLRTWQSWDPSVDQANRRAQTFVTLQETAAIVQSTNEYRRQVYEKTNYNWDAYVRGDEPVLDPIAQGVVGEGGQTLVQGPDGKLFDFSGNQYKKPGT